MKEMRVLIVENDDATRALLRTVFSREHEVHLATDGEMAWSAIEGAEFDLITLDLLLPQLSGYELLDRMSATRPDLIGRTVVVTADTRVLQQPIQYAVAATIVKPFRIEQIIAMVDRMRG